MRALVLDDDPAIGRLVRTIADPVGFVTELTTNALQFRSSYKTDLPDVVLLDLQIGETDGVEQLRFLSGEGYRNPLVLMSGFDDRVLATTEHLARSMGLRAVAALSKPLRAADLTRVLDQIKMTLEPVSEDRENPLPNDRSLASLPPRC
jgi:DNA-binding NtrC family response regulator